MRTVWVHLHRWVGLALVLFVTVAGLTGSLLAFEWELDRAISPQMFPAAPPGARRLGLGELLERASQIVPQAVVEGVYLGDPERARVNVSGRPDPQTGAPTALGFNELFLNPYTGAELGRSTWGRIGDGWHNFTPLVLDIHCSLMAGEVGSWAFGLAALLWTLDCVVALWLTLPPRNPTGPAFWQRWRPAWQIKRSAGRYRLWFDVHRAAGLWLWLALGVFAWSGVYMNLSQQVYQPVMSRWLEFPDLQRSMPAMTPPLVHPALGWVQAEQRAEALLQQEGGRLGFRVVRPVRMYLDRDRGVYFYDAYTSLDFQDKRGATTVYFDANTGEQRLLLLPSGQYSGQTVTNWLVALHEANVWGLPYKVFVALLGLVSATLAVTGVYVWWRKRKARNSRTQMPSAT